MKTSAKIFTAISVIVVLGLIAAVIALAIGLYGMKMRADENARRVDYMYETALCESLDSVREAENDLAKMLVSAEGETLSLASDIRMSAGSAAARVANLPVDLYTYSGLEKFLNQVSDFMSGYIRAVESGRDAEEYNEQLESLYETILSVRKKLEEAANKLGGDYSIAEDINESGSFNIGEGDFNVEYPGIIYDGPFSDSRDTSWKALDDKAEIGESDALDVLKDGVGMTGRITCRSSGDADLYVAEGTAADGSSAYATVTVRGGMIALYSAHLGDTDGEISRAEAQKLALGYAEKAGYTKSLSPVWYNSSDGDITVTLAPEINDVVYYPDLIKIKLRAGDGALAGIEACSYCANFRDRGLVSPRVSEQEAREKVSAKLSVENVRLALIPDGNDERLCYEFASEYRGLDYFVYIDAATGAQAEVLRVIDDHQGKQVI